MENNDRRAKKERVSIERMREVIHAAQAQATQRFRLGFLLTGIMRTVSFRRRDREDGESEWKQRDKLKRERTVQLRSNSKSNPRVRVQYSSFLLCYYHFLY